MLIQAHIYVIGDVIGVGFRAWVKIQTKNTKVTGWVKNVYNNTEVFGPPGGVEGLIQGGRMAVEDTIDHIKRGSPISRVDGVRVFYEDPKEIFKDFLIKKSDSYSLQE